VIKTRLKLLFFEVFVGQLEEENSTERKNRFGMSHEKPEKPNPFDIFGGHGIGELGEKGTTFDI
jgi:hypothetical protein